MVLRESIQYIKDNLNDDLIGVEVGVSGGRHAGQILKALGCKLYLVDIWEDYYENFRLDQTPQLSVKCASSEKVKELLKDYEIRVMVGDSVKIAERFPDEYFDFVYIDANHTYERVRADIMAWKPKIIKGGVLCGHDYCNECEGVKKAVDELAVTGKIRFIKKEGCIYMARCN